MGRSLRSRSLPAMQVAVCCSRFHVVGREGERENAFHPEVSSKSDFLPKDPNTTYHHMQVKASTHKLRKGHISVYNRVNAKIDNKKSWHLNIIFKCFGRTILRLKLQKTMKTNNQLIEISESDLIIFTFLPSTYCFPHKSLLQSAWHIEDTPYVYWINMKNKIAVTCWYLPNCINT